MPSQTTTATQTGNASTPKNENNSLLGLPSEIRVLIYEYLFPWTTMCLETSKRWNVVHGRHENIAQAHEDDPATIDDGITLTCSLLRTESLPVVRQSLDLEIILGRCVAGQVQFRIKDRYLESIREAVITFSSLDHCDLPFHKLPSLQKVQINSDGQSDALPINVDLKTCHKWARALDFESLVQKAKGNTLIEAQGSGLHDVLSDAARGFTIIWTDLIELQVDDKEMGEVFVCIREHDSSKQGKAD
jgi:hypothetical protein